MPVAAVNGKEIPEAKAFTLCHEVVHLMLSASHEEAPAAREQRRGEDWLQVNGLRKRQQSHANARGGSACGDQRSGVVPVGLDIPSVRRVAKNFPLTPLATATRLRKSVS